MLIAILGLLYFKWTPYWYKSFVAASTHQIGTSILMGNAASYAWAYGKAVRQAMVLGLLLGSAVQALLPSQWILRWLDRTNAGSVLRGTMLAVPPVRPSLSAFRCCAAKLSV